MAGLLQFGLDPAGLAVVKTWADRGHGVDGVLRVPFRPLQGGAPGETSVGHLVSGGSTRPSDVGKPGVLQDDPGSNGPAVSVAEIALKGGLDAGPEGTGAFQVGDASGGVDDDERPAALFHRPAVVGSPHLLGNRLEKGLDLAVVEEKAAHRIVQVQRGLSFQVNAPVEAAVVQVVIIFAHLGGSIVEEADAQGRVHKAVGLDQFPKDPSTKPGGGVVSPTYRQDDVDPGQLHVAQFLEIPLAVEGGVIEAVAGAAVAFQRLAPARRHGIGLGRVAVVGRAVVPVEEKGGHLHIRPKGRGRGRGGQGGRPGRRGRPGGPRGGGRLGRPGKASWEWGRRKGRRIGR